MEFGSSIMVQPFIYAELVTMILCKHSGSPRMTGAAVMHPTLYMKVWILKSSILSYTKGISVLVLCR